MLPRATKICEVLRRELTRREKVLEIDRTLTKIHFEIILGKRSGDPVRVLYNGHSETDLTSESDLSK
jgi:hypothetical protein